jgi:ATP-dependent helicase/nuclease subunit A
VSPDQDQRTRAIRGTNRSFVVEASAGTGKTSTLVGRILHLVLESGPRGTPLPLGSICAITFTEKAAGEMKIRLRQELEIASLRPEPKGALARAALSDLETASISTFHAFAVSLLKERPVEAGLDPHFVALDALQSDLYFRDTWESWVNRALAGRPEPFEKALRTGIGLGQIQDLAATLCRHGHTARLLELLPPSSEEELAGKRQELLRESEPYPAMATGRGDLLLPPLARAIAWLQDPASGLLPEAARGGKSANWAGGRATVLLIRGFISRVAEFARLWARLRSQRAFHALIRWLIDEFLPEWEDRKRVHGYLDFDDQLEAARRLLMQSPAARKEFHKRFATLLVDEFQDTDPVQLDIVLLLSCTDLSESDPARLRPDPGRLFTVGDPKQSIYRFRGADVETYLETLEEGRMKALMLERLTLTTNFRSVPSILKFVDAAFDGVMRTEGSYQRDYLPFGCAGARTEEASPPAVHILCERDVRGLLLGSGKDYYRQEARRIARLIARIRIEGSWQVEDSTGGKPVLRAPRYGDIAILLPVLTKVEALEEALRQKGIPYVLEGGKFYYARSEVASAITVLRSVANPNDTVALYGALRSVFFGLSDEKLLRARFEGLPLDYRIEAPEGSPLRRPYAILHALHRERHQRPASETLEILLQKTGAREVLAVRGFQSLANLAKLTRQLRSLQQETTFSQVVTLLGLIDEESMAESESRLMEERNDAVRVMTIHKAKGLDFRIAILAGLGIPRRRRTECFLADPHELRIFALKTGAKEDGWQTPGWEELVQQDQKRENAELVRLLYVAMTRARDHLVISIHNKGKIDNEIGRIKASFEGTRLAPLAGFLSERLPVDGSLSAFIDARSLDVGGVTATPSSGVRQQDWRSRLREEYAELNSLLSATPHSFATDAESPTGSQDDRGWETPRSRAMRSGIVFHEAMERVDFFARSGIPHIAANLGAVHGLDPPSIAAIDEMMRKCLDSPLIERARVASRSGKRVWREIPILCPLSGPAGTTFEESKIDLLFEEEGGWVIVDYKTDLMPQDPQELNQLLRVRYAGQMQQYTSAIEALGLKAKEADILLARTGESIRIWRFL